MSKFFYAATITEPEHIRPYLADPVKHWKKGYSACELATSWIKANGVPAGVVSVLNQRPELQNPTLIEAFFEKETHLKTQGRPSQTDLLAFVKFPAGHGVIGVEGKVEEPFGQLVSEWNDGSKGKIARLESLCALLGTVFSKRNRYVISCSTAQQQPFMRRKDIVRL
jgi:hypothetical protein